MDILQKSKMKDKRRRSAAACMSCVSKKARCSNFRPCQRCVDLKTKSCDDLDTGLKTSLATITNALGSSRTHDPGLERNSLLRHWASGYPWLRNFENKVIDSNNDCQWSAKPLLQPVTDFFLLLDDSYIENPHDFALALR